MIYQCCVYLAHIDSDWAATHVWSIWN